MTEPPAPVPNWAAETAMTPSITYEQQQEEKEARLQLLRDLKWAIESMPTIRSERDAKLAQIMRRAFEAISNANK